MGFGDSDLTVLSVVTPKHAYRVEIDKKNGVVKASRSDRNKPALQTTRIATNPGTDEFCSFEYTQWQALMDKNDTTSCYQQTDFLDGTVNRAEQAGIKMLREFAEEVKAPVISFELREGTDYESLHSASLAAEDVASSVKLILSTAENYAKN